MRGGRRIPGNFRSRLTFGFRFGKVKMPPCHRPRMDPRIRNLPSTTFCGERLSRRAIAEIQETVQFFPELTLDTTEGLLIPIRRTGAPADTST